MNAFLPITVLADAAASAVARRSLLEYIQAGGIIGYILLILSVVAVALLVAHLLKVRLSVMAPTPVVAGLEDRLRVGD
ncbi:MAG: hypothetical protein JSS51_06515, partial [Planctomycetes bacterium]|nr:hypothetical protein [Planctomycetota bacterium]